MARRARAIGGQCCTIANGENQMTKYAINVPNYVENEDAYIRAVQDRIAANARKGRYARWIASDPKAAIIDNFLHCAGDFAPVRLDNRHWQNNALVTAAAGGFYYAMREALNEYGSLTEKQMAAVIAMMERAQTRLDNRAKAIAEAANRSSHIGAIKERRDFELTIKLRTGFDGDFGYVHIFVLEDSAGNVVVYKGSVVLGERGDTVKVKATIKAHSERDGIAQTIITRPALA
jgi:hypothetical protein